MQAPHSAASRHLHSASSTAGGPTAALRPYEVHPIRSVSRRILAEAAEAATRSAALADYGGGTPTESSPGAASHWLPDQPPHHVATAGSGTKSAMAATHSGLGERQICGPDQPPHRQEPLIGHRLAAEDGPPAETWPDYWVRPSTRALPLFVRLTCLYVGFPPLEYRK